MKYLSQNDTQHWQWYISGKISSNTVWLNDAEINSPLIDIKDVLLHKESTIDKDYFAYT